MSRSKSLLLLVSLVACGGDSTPTENTGNNTNSSSVASVSVTGPGTVAFGGTVTLQAVAKNSAGTALAKTFTWSSSHENIATVSSTGVVTGVSAGAATITATADGIAGTRVVNVQASAASVTVAGIGTLGIGRSHQFTAVARTASGTQVNTTFTWSTSNGSVATVSNNGLVTAVGAGTATITAQAATGAQGTADIVVEVNNLNQIVESIRQQHGVPALIGAIVTRNSGMTSIGVAGNRRQGGPPATINDKWHIGSNLKGITAALAGIAVKKGQINWSTTVASMFPELGNNIRTEYRTATLRDLLAMRAGIRNDPPASAYTGATARVQRETAAAWGLAATPQNALGTFYYSNISYVIAGAMIERAMGGTFEQLLVGELGTPAGATQIGFGPQAAQGANNQPVAHSWNGSWVPCEACDNPPGLSAAGRAHMSMPDWASIIRELMRADANQSTLIDQTNARAIFSSVTPIPGSGDSYGLGWNMTTRPWGGRTAQHEGSNLSNHSVAWVGLDNGIALLAATNAADLNGGRTGAALEALVSRLLVYHQTGQ